MKTDRDISVLPELAPVSILEQYFGRVSSYDVARLLPKDIIVKFSDRRLRVHVGKLRAWIEAGGLNAANAS